MDILKMSFFDFLKILFSEKKTKKRKIKKIIKNIFKAFMLLIINTIN